MRILSATFGLLAALLGACTGEPNGPYIEFLGGGFVFNYRLAEANYGFVVKPVRRIPDGTILEAEFDDPSASEPIVVTRIAHFGQLQYVFRTPPLSGVEAGVDYHVELRLRAADDGRILATYRKTFRSDFDQTMLPERAPVIGPGYQRTPPAPTPKAAAS